MDETKREFFELAEFAPPRFTISLFTTNCSQASDYWLTVDGVRTKKIFFPLKYGLEAFFIVVPLVRFPG